MKKYLVFVVLFCFWGVLHAKNNLLKISWEIPITEFQFKDMILMPNEDTFLILTENTVQTWNIIDGTRINSKTISEKDYNEMAIAKDKLYIVGKKFLKYDLQTFDSVGEFLYLDDYPSPGLYTKFNFVDIAMHPTQPIAYIVRYRNAFLSGGKQSKSYFIDIFNTDEMKPIGQLTADSDTLIEWSNIDISKDGKYLVGTHINSTSQSPSVKIWSLETKKELASLPYGGSKHAYFSSNSKLLYFSAGLPKEPNSPVGFFVYDIENRKIIDSSLTTLKYNISANEFIIDEIHNRCYMSPYLYDLKSNEIIDTTSFYIINKLVYNSKNSCILGIGNNGITKILLDTNKSKVDDNTFEMIYPNPVNNIVTIISNCTQPIYSYQILNMNGEVLIPKSEPNLIGKLMIDFYKYPSGTYFINLHCGNTSKIYKIIKGS